MKTYMDIEIKLISFDVQDVVRTSEGNPFGGDDIGLPNPNDPAGQF